MRVTLLLQAFTADNMEELVVCLIPCVSGYRFDSSPIHVLSRSNGHRAYCYPICRPPLIKGKDALISFLRFFVQHHIHISQYTAYSNSLAYFYLRRQNA